MKTPRTVLALTILMMMSALAAAACCIRKGPEWKPYRWISEG